MKVQSVMENSRHVEFRGMMEYRRGDSTRSDQCDDGTGCVLEWKWT